MRERLKAAQPIARVAKTVEDVIGCEFPSVQIILMVSPAAPVNTRVTTVALKEYIRNR